MGNKGKKQRGLVADTIGMIQSFVLSGYDDGLSIVQELVQNADDAKSNNLEFRWFLGIKECSHPLLKQPFLVVSDDGEFNNDNEEAISHIGVGTKANNSSTIGKFGLGMKSIFHWCDMFFYLKLFSKDDISGSINPYARDNGEDDIHPGWILNNEDLDVLKASLENAIDSEEKRFFPKKSEVFSLVIPLRIKSDEESIKNTYYDHFSLEELLFGKETKENAEILLIKMLATLKVTSKSKRLDRVRFVSSQTDWIFEIDNEKRKIKSILNSEKKKEAEFFSIVPNISSEIKEASSLLQSSEVWPQITDREQKKQIPQIMPVEDSSLILISVKEDVAVCELSYASYLPLKEKNQITTNKSYYDEKSKQSLYMILNAPFGIDSGRNGIVDYNRILTSIINKSSDDSPSIAELNNEYISEIRDQSRALELWNLILLRDVLFPSIPRLLFEFKNHNVKDSEQIAYERLFDLLRQNHPFETMAASQNYCAYRLVKEEDSIAYVFDLLSYDKPILTIPYEDDSFAEIFSKVVQLDCNVVIENKFRNILGIIDKTKVTSALSVEHNTIIEDFLLELSSFDFDKIKKKDIFWEYIAAIFESWGRNKDIKLTEDALNNCIYLINTLLLSRIADDKINLRKEMRNAFSSISSILGKFGNILFVIANNEDPSLFKSLWNSANNSSIIVLPRSLYEKDKSSYLGKRRDIAADYLRLDVRPLFNEVENKYIGILFEALVINVLTTSKKMDAALIKECEQVFSGMNIIPAAKYTNGEKQLDVYISFDMVRDPSCSIFSEVAINLQKDIIDLYNYAIDLPPVYTLRNDVIEQFGLNKDDFKQIAFDSIFLNEYHTYTGRFDDEYAEKVIKQIFKSTDNVNAIRSSQGYKFFPSLDGSHVSIKDPNVYLDCRETHIAFDYHHKKLYAFIEIEDPNLRNTIENSFNSKVINDANFLEKYFEAVGNDSVIDTDLVLLYSDYWKKVGTDLKEKKWFNKNGKSYSCSRIILKENINELIRPILSKECYLVSSSELDQDDFRKINNNGLIVGNIKDIDKRVLRECLKGYSSLTPLGGLRQDDKDVFKSVLEYILKSSASNSIKSIAALCLERMETSIEDINEIFSENAASYSSNDICKVLYQISKDSAFKEFKYVVDYAIERKIRLSKNDEALKRILFPSCGIDWGSLDSLCDGSLYPVVSKSSKINTVINWKDLLENESIESVSIGQVQSKKLNHLEVGTLIRFSKLNSLLGLIFFLTRDPVFRKESYTITATPKTDEYYLDIIRKGDFNTFGSGSHYMAKTLAEIMNINREGAPLIEFYKEDKNSKIEVLSILGNRFSADFSRENVSTFYSRIEAIGNGRIAVFLNDISKLENEDKQRLVIELIDAILEKVYYQKDPKRFEGALKEQIGAIAKDIEIVQNIISKKFEDFFTHIKYDKNNEIGKEISQLIRTLTELDYKISDCEIKDDSTNRGKYELEYSHKCKAFTNQLTPNNKRSLYIISCICKTMEERAYTENSVLFELFQNADDASLQEGLQDKNYFYSISFQADTLNIKHNGRPINRVINGHNEWERDFLNMLSFKSDKQKDSESKETGKFGYGFKSCYLISNNPHIYSGAVSASIIAGFYPKYDEPTIECNQGETLIKLPIKSGVNIPTIIRQFSNQISGLLLFSKKIKEIEVYGEKYQSIEKSAGIYSIVNIKNEKFLKLSNNDKSVSLAFKINDGKLVKVPDINERVWCGTPLNNSSKQAYLINSTSFLVDVGRTQAAKDDKRNEIISGKAVSLLIRALCDIIDETVPEDIIEELSDQDTAVDLCKLISEGQGDSLVASIFKDTIGYIRCNRNLCFTGESLVEIKNHEFVSVSEDYYNELRKKLKLDKLFDYIQWHIFNSHFGSDKYILIRNNVVCTDNKLENKINDFDDLCSFLARENKELSPEVYKYLRNLDEYIDYRKFRYKTVADTYVDLDRVVSIKESDLYKIAPKENRLSDEYELEFEYNKIPDNLAIDWILATEDKDARVAALRLISERGFSILLSLSSYLKDPDCWIRNWDQYARLINNKDICNYLESILVRYIYDENIMNDNYVNSVYSWWKDQPHDKREKAIEKYRKHFYGKEELDLELKDDKIPDDWYRLLYLTGLRSMGRVNPQANINFVETFMLNFDYRSIPSRNADTLKKWMQLIVLRPMRFYRNNSFEEWRKYLPFFAQISYCAVELYHLFIGSGFETKGEIKQLLNYSNMPELSGTDIKGPDLSHSLGKFYPLICLEILSNKEISQNLNRGQIIKMEKECFYPTLNVRNYLGVNDAKEFYVKWSNLVQDDDMVSRFKEYLAYPFYCYEIKDSNNGDSVDIFADEELQSC